MKQIYSFRIILIYDHFKKYANARSSETHCYIITYACKNFLNEWSLDCNRGKKKSSGYERFYYHLYSMAYRVKFRAAIIWGLRNIIFFFFEPTFSCFRELSITNRRPASTLLFGSSV